MLDKFNNEQLYGYNTMMSGANCFVSGDAGTGKSSMLNEFIENSRKAGKNVAVTAPTGIAAINVNGVTLHRLMHLPINPLVYSPDMIKYTKELLDIDILIIDEISMCRLDLFDYTMISVGHANVERKKKGKKAIQIIVVGDFFQLPPVIVDRDRSVLNEHYGYDIGRGFAFQSKYWNMIGFTNIILKQVMRQSDSIFKNLLSQARVGNTLCIYGITQNSCKQYIDNAITILGTNKAVREKNEEELKKIKSREYVYEAEIDGEVKDSDKMTDDELVLKIGARVMTLVNHHLDLYQNGSIGTVTNCTDEYVEVLMDSGCKVKIRPYEWEIKSYSIKNDNNKKRLSADVIGVFKQIPLKLAYAITVHKSQGQTYDAANINPYSWDCGQLYVALSRVKTIEQLYLTAPILNRYLIASKDVINFYRNL